MVQTTMEKEVEATAWCEYSNDEECQYRLQINNIAKRSVRKVAKSCADWRDSGFGWHPKHSFLRGAAKTHDVETHDRKYIPVETHDRS